ncbi:MAG: transpeptidase family protein [Raineya sp.]|jgi:cell division protein FtsI (penicillin-binding protein 3)|nr:transpeptidase family protein [Raineya sp.]
MNIKKSILLRIRIAFLAISLISAISIIRIWVLQQGKWEEKFAKRDIRSRKIPAQRGNIYATDGSLLATSMPYYKVAIDPTIPDSSDFKKNIDSLARKLSDFFQEGTPTAYKNNIIKARKSKKRFIYLSNKRIDYQAKQKMSEWVLFKSEKASKSGKGKRGMVIFEPEYQRFKPFGMLAARTLGYISDDAGVGLEYAFDKQLAGKSGRALFQRISGGNWVPYNRSPYIEPEDGLDIYTTLDVNIQDVAQEALSEAVIDNEADFGCVVVMEVATGEIKALANLGRNEDGTYTENYNYAIGDRGSTDPGSVFKLASMMALLEDKAVKVTDYVDTEDGIKDFYGVRLNDVKKGGFGTITVQRMFEVSSSIGIAKLVNDRFKQTPTKFIDYLQKFGLNTPLDFQMAGEAKPYIKTPQDPTWSATSLPWMSIGYETRISPLQMLAFYNAVANNGKMVQPIIVKSIKNADEVIQDFETIVLKEKICSDSTIMLLKMLLEGVVERGTAKLARNNLYKIAGKTSTSQKFKNGKYVKAYHTSFAGFFPSQKPKYSCIVVIDNPRGERQYGGDVAAPVFKRVADKLFYQDIELQRSLSLGGLPNNNFVATQVPAYTSILKQAYQALGVLPQSIDTTAEWTKASFNPDASISLQKADVKKGFMPNLKGYSLRDALFILENRGVKVKVEGQGKVYQQSVRPGRGIGIGDKVTLKLR